MEKPRRFPQFAVLSARLMRVYHHLILCVSRKKQSFENLKFISNSQGTQIAELTFKNGYTVVVTQGTGTVTTVGSPYQLECIPQNANISDDVIGYLTSDEVTELMYEIQSLKKVS